MRKITMDKLINKDKKAKTLQLQLASLANLSKDKRIDRKERQPEELDLLARAIKKKYEKYLKEGVLIKNGRNWTFNFRR